MKYTKGHISKLSIYSTLWKISENTWQLQSMAVVKEGCNMLINSFELCRYIAWSIICSQHHVQKPFLCMIRILTAVHLIHEANFMEQQQKTCVNILDTSFHFHSSQLYFRFSLTLHIYLSYINIAGSNAINHIWLACMGDELTVKANNKRSIQHYNMSVGIKKRTVNQWACFKTCLHS